MQKARSRRALLSSFTLSPCHLVTLSLNLLSLASNLIPYPRRVLVRLALHRFLKLRLELLDRVDRELFADVARELLQDLHLVRLGERLFLAEAGEEFFDRFQAVADDLQRLLELLVIEEDRRLGADVHHRDVRAVLLEHQAVFLIEG